MTRVLSGVLLAAVFLAIVWFGSATMLLLVALGVCVLAFQEYAQLVRRIGIDLARPPTLIATLAALTTVPFPYVAGEAVVGIGLILIAVGIMARESVGDTGSAGPGFIPAIQAVAAGALSIVYLGLPLGSLVGVHIFGGRTAVLLLVATIVVSDTAQYYSGRLFGYHLLSSRISPKKTIEGAIGGFVTAPVFLYFGGPYLVPTAPPLKIALVGIALVLAGIAGDLFESLLKRAANVKDSSTLIPGHGGVLDRIDALLFATPVFYMYLRWVYTA